MMASMPAPASRPAGWRLAIALQLLAVVATALYWIIWFVNRAWLANQDTPAYYAFENAFPLADAWMALASLAGAIALLRRHATALLFMLLAGSASIYLGLLDVLYNLENGVYAGATGASLAVEVVINLASFAIPIYIIAFAWRARHVLLGVPVGASHAG
jgi:hypothetical protein